MFQPLFVRPLTPEEREGLRQFTESTCKEEAARARVILASAEGKTAIEISNSFGSHPTNIKKCIRKFNSEGLEGISAKKRGPQGGPRPRFSNVQIDEVLRLASINPVEAGYGFKEWSLQKLANAAMARMIVDRISHVTVRQMLKRQGEGNGTAQTSVAVAP